MPDSLHLTRKTYAYHYLFPKSGQVVRLETRVVPCKVNSGRGEWQGMWILKQWILPDDIDAHPSNRGTWCMASFPEISWQALERLVFLGRVEVS